MVTTILLFQESVNGLWYKAVGSHPSSSLLTHFRVNVFAMECISHKKNGLLKYFRVNEILLLIEDMRTVQDFS